MKTWKHLFLGVLLLFFVSFCGEHKSNLEIVGSDTMLEISQILSEAFYQKTKKPVNILGGGSGVGINLLLQKQILIANSSREITDSEEKQAKQKNLKLIKLPIAKDFISIIVNKDNPIKNLTSNTLEKIYTGKITNWQQLGGANIPINLYGRQTSSGTALFVQIKILHKQDFFETVNEMTGNPQIVEAVKKDKGAIGYVGLSYALERKKDVSILKIDDALPQSYRDNYVLKRNLYCIFLDPKNTSIQEWFQFIYSPTGKKVIQDVGYQPLLKNEIKNIKNQFAWK